MACSEPGHKVICPRVLKNDHEVNMDQRGDEEYLALLAGEERSFGSEQDGKHERPSV